MSFSLEAAAAIPFCLRVIASMETNRRLLVFSAYLAKAQAIHLTDLSYLTDRQLKTPNSMQMAKQKKLPEIPSKKKVTTNS
jgi:hypothetical protein